MLYKGSCHGGKVAFEVESEVTGAVRCNCSICSRKGALLCAIPHESLTVLAWGDDLGTYTFGNHATRTGSAALAAFTPSPRMLAKGMKEVPISIFIASRGRILPPCRFSTSTAARPDASQLSTRFGPRTKTVRAASNVAAPQ